MRRGRGLALRSSALQLSQHSLGPSLPPLGIHTLLAQVIFIIFSVIYFPNTFSQGFLQMTAISLGTTCAVSQFHLLPPTDVPAQTYIPIPKMTPFETQMRSRQL